MRSGLSSQASRDRRAAHAVADENDRSRGRVDDAGDMRRVAAEIDLIGRRVVVAVSRQIDRDRIVAGRL